MTFKNEDITGKLFTKLLVKNFIGKGLWMCECLCGKIVFLKKNRLTSGHSRSCGCMKFDKLNSKRKEYSSWQHMKSRCKNDPGYSHVNVCERWINSFDNFIEDMGQMPSANYSIDRIDNSKGYEPTNCRWASKITQTINRDWNKNNTSGIRGVSYCSIRNKWIGQISIHGKNYAKRFDEINDAVEFREKMFKQLHESFI